MDRGGLTRLSMADGKFAPFAGFDGLVLNGTAWAESKERYRNVVTGEERRITPRWGCGGREQNVYLTPAD